MEMLSGPSCSMKWLCQWRGERLAKTPHTSACAHEVEGEGGRERGFASPRWAPPPRASLQPGERVGCLSLGVFQGGDPPAQSWVSHLLPQLQTLCLGIISAISYVPAVAES